jgi:hypothetical protein
MKITLPPGLPAGTEELYRSFLETEPRSRAELLEDLEEYLAHVYSLDADVVDLATAAKLGAAIKDLIETADEDQLTHVEAATLYFIAEDDEDGDTSSPVGFDDDVAVFNAVCQFLSRKDLVIRL